MSSRFLNKMRDSKSRRIFWFGPVVLLWAVIILPSSFHAVWASFDDGVTLVMAKLGLSACFNMNAGRIMPIYWLHNWLLYQIGGVDPTIWYVIQSFEFLLSALLIYSSIGCISNNWFVSALTAGVFLTSAPIAENAYTISKGEPRLMLFLTGALFLTAFYFKTVLFQPSRTRGFLMKSVWGFFFSLVVFLLIFSMESGVAVIAMGIVGIAASFLYLEQPFRKTAIRFFTYTAIIMLPVVALMILFYVYVLNSVKSAYTSISLNLSRALDNLVIYSWQSPDIFMIVFGCLILGGIHLFLHRKNHKDLFEIQSRASAVMAWGMLATGMIYFMILLAWRFHSNYYMLPVGICASLSMGYFLTSTKTTHPDRRHRFLRWSVGILLFLVVLGRFYSIPYLHFIATAQRGFDILEDQVFRETLAPQSTYRRVLDLSRVYFWEQPQQRNLLYQAFGATDHRWIGARDLLRPYSKEAKKLFQPKDVSPLEKAPPAVDDLLVIRSGRCPFNIELRGVTPSSLSYSTADREVQFFKEHIGLGASKRGVLGSRWTVFRPWSLRMDTLGFNYDLYVLKEGFVKAVWEGRFSDGWIGEKATLKIEENENISPGCLRFRTDVYPWSVPIRITITGTKVQTIELDSEHYDRSIGIDEILPSRKGSIEIVVSKTWVLQKFKLDSKEVRSLGVQVDYEEGSPVS
jgi:hypothetical protein